MPSAKAKMHWNPTATGLAATTVVAVLLTVAGLDVSTPATELAIVPPIAVVFGIAMGLLHSRRLWSVFWGTALGLLAGISSSWGLIGQQVQSLFPTVLATLALLTSIGFLIGAFIEFVQLLHYIAHGNDIKTYRSDPEKR